MMRKLLSPPVFEQEDQNFRARFINGFAWSVIGLLLLAITPHLLGGSKNFTVVIFFGLILGMLVALYLLRRGEVNTSGLIMIILGWIGVTLQAYTADGVRDVMIVGFIALGLLASVITNWRIGGIVVLSGMAVIWTLAVLQVNQYIVPSLQDPIAFARDLSLMFIAITVLIYFSSKSMRDAFQRARTSETDLLLSNENWKELNQHLEDQVAARTAELTLVNARNERRARQFEAIAMLARATTSIHDQDMLLPHIARVVSEQFGFYHVGIFLLDENIQHAVLQASNSEGGRKLLAQRYRLPVGQAGIIGQVAASGTPRMMLDVKTDAAFQENPELPGTRAEMALPLRSGENIIGVLDLQSTDPNAFQSDDTEILLTLADQVTIAIQNAQTHEAAHKLLEQAQRTSVSYLKDAWRLLQEHEKNVGYLVSEGAIKPLDKFVSAPHINQVVAQGEVVVEDGDAATLAVPIYLRDEVVGVLDVHVPAGHDWDQDEIDIVKAVSERLSLALESATLLRSSQRRAEIERLTAGVSGKISSSINLRNVLQTAVEELGHLLPGSEVVIQLQSDPHKAKVTR